MPLEVQKGSREICFEMKGGFPSGLRKVLLLRVVPLLLLLVENHGAIATTRAAAAVATYNNGGDGDDDHPVVAPRRNHRKLENRPSTEVIPNAYIILLNDNVTATPEAIAKEYGITVEHAFKHAIKGFSSRYVEAAILDLLLEDSRIWAVGEDGNLEMEHEGPHEVVQQKEEEEEAEEGGDDGGGEVVHMQQVAAPGQHLDQIDQSMDGMYSYTYTGAGVHIYVVDAGILASHADFGGRVVTPCFNDIGPCNTDTDSHGTHIASIAGGSAYGVAKGVTIHDTRVYDANGIVSWSGLMSGLDYIAGEQRKRSNTTTVVVNVSLGGGGYNVVDAAVQKTLDTGAVIVVAAGNQAIDACTRTPARVPGVVTVGATGASPNVRRPSSNYGPCLDIWAPGKEIIAASNLGVNQYSTKSGTSMSAPLVVGAIALYIEAGKTVQDLLNDAQLIPELAGTDQSPMQFLSTMKLNVGGETPDQSIMETFNPATNPALEPSYDVSNGATFAPIPAPTFRPSDMPIAAPIAVPGEGEQTIGTLFPSPGPNLASIPAPIVPPTSLFPSPGPSLASIPAPIVPPFGLPSLAPIPFPTAGPTPRPIAPASLQPSPRPTRAPLPIITTTQPSPRPTRRPTLVPTLPPSPVPTRLPVASPAPTKKRVEEDQEDDSSSTIAVDPLTTLVPLTIAPAVSTLAPATNRNRARYPSMTPRDPFPPSPPSPPRFHYPTVSPQSREQEPNKGRPTFVPTQRPYGNFTFIVEPDDNEPSPSISSMAATSTFMSGSNGWISLWIVIPIFLLCT